MRKVHIVDSYLGALIITVVGTGAAFLLLHAIAVAETELSFDARYEAYESGSIR